MILWGKEESKSGLRVSNKMNNGATEHSKTQARKGPDVKRHLHILVAYTSDLRQPIITKEHFLPSF